MNDRTKDQRYDLNGMLESFVINDVTNRAATDEALRKVLAECAVRLVTIINSRQMIDAGDAEPKLFEANLIAGALAVNALKEKL